MSSAGKNATLLVLLLGACAIAGCGQGDRKERPSGFLDRLGQAQHENTTRLVSGREIRAAGPGPAGTILQWWRLVQFSAPTSRIASFFEPGHRPRRAVLAKQLKTLGYLFASRRPIVTDVEVHGVTARVFTFITENTRTGAAGEPALFRLKRFGGRWLLIDNEYVSRRYEAEQRYARR